MGKMFVNNNKERVKVQTFDSAVGWKTLYTGDKVEAFNEAYENAYLNAGLTLADGVIEEPKTEKVVKKKVVKKKVKKKRLFGRR